MRNGTTFKQYTIKSGDTLSKIARKNGTDYRSLYDLVGPDGIRNSDRLRGDSADRIYPGEVIYVPDSSPADSDKSKPGGKAGAGTSGGKTSVKGRYRFVKQGECLESIAFKCGFSWESLWNLPENAGLKEKRKNPNTLLPGDRIFVPDLRERKEPEPDKEKHSFIKKGNCYLQVVLLDEDNEPRADVQYELEVDGQTYFERTDGLGSFKKPVPPDAKSCKLYVNYREDAYVLQLRHLNPCDEISGLQARLNNLGYDSGEVSGEMNDMTRSALIEFQADHDLEAKGQFDEATISRLEEIYGN